MFYQWMRALLGRPARLSLLPALMLACPSLGQLRVVSYNTLGGPSSEAEEQLARTIFGAIASDSVNGIAKRPDIIGLQEQITFSTSTDQRLANALNAEFGVSSYQTIRLRSGSFVLAYVYDSATVTPQFSQEVPLGIRPGLRTQWRPVGYDANADLYTYSVHFKAGDTTSDRNLRNTEATNLRNNADALGDGASVIYMGDFNISSSSETSYGTLTSSGNGQAHDPVNLSNWPDVLSRKYLTQSTRSTSLPDGGSSGGLDDRFDMQLVTNELLDGEGLSYIGSTSAGGVGTDHSYKAFGNDGLLFNVAINSFYNGREQPANVLDALHFFSDHLPVVADYQLPAMMQVTVAPSPDTVIVGAQVDVDFDVSNVAPVDVALGADELDYTFSTLGGFSGSGGGSDDATGSGNAHSVAYRTNTPSIRNGRLLVDATSNQAADASFVQNVGFTVLDHANASFDDAVEQDTLHLDLGDFAIGGPTTPGDAFSIHNLASSFGDALTATLDLDNIVETDTDNKFTLNGGGFVGLGANEQSGYTIDGLADEMGSFSAQFGFELSDQDLPGAADHNLTLTVEFDVVGLLGDMNGDGSLTNGDISAFVLALTNAGGYQSQFPGIDPDILGDFTGDGALTNGDINGFVNALTGGGPGSSASAIIPEPSTLAMIAMGGLLAGRRRRGV